MGHRVINSPTLEHTTCTQHQTWCGCGLNTGHVEEQGFIGAIVSLLLLLQPLKKPILNHLLNNLFKVALISI